MSADLIYTEINHPLIAHKLGILRDKHTPSWLFRTMINELSVLLIYEALRDVKSVSEETEIWSGKYIRKKIPADSLAFISVLRAGIGMLDAASHSGSREPCRVIESVVQIKTEIEQSKPDIIAIEEAQFFDYQEFVSTLKLIIRLQIKTVISGLDMDFMGNPFENIIYAMGIAQKVDKLSAVCVVCGQDATMTYKKQLNSLRVEIGETDLYEARRIMDIRITAKQMELTTALRDYVNTRFSRINKFGDMFSAAEVHLDSEKREQKVTANLKGGKKHFFSEAVDPADMYKAN
ncbi:hypothetical protein CHS0354_026794 [Potamilus streckersoni]|uniref:Thymidine kinase n=1 Tax=Potamilus streckersoni TaxID=2493646 RepID=A0AAE0T6C4_9BIVA|nr:hypothetical protein CHS0354_026794 [Potamilus streckersoni]